MTQLVIENLEEEVRAKLQDLAREHGRTISEEARDILRSAVTNEPGEEANLGTRLARRFADCGLDQEIPELRGHLLQPPSFES